MAHKSCLGIHYNDQQITAVLVQKQGNIINIAPAIKISASDLTHMAGTQEAQADNAITEKDSLSIALIEQLSQKLSLEYDKIPPVTLSLSARLYQSLFHHSQFEDPRQLQQTLRYDIEDEFAIDAEFVALCNQPISNDSPGTDMIVHTMQRQQLKSLLDRFDLVALDPLIAQPDIDSWLNYLQQQNELSYDQPCVLIAEVHDTVYMVFLDNKHQPILVRTFPVSHDEHKYELLSCEFNRSYASLSQDQIPIVILYHSQNLLSPQIEQLAQQNDIKSKKLGEADPVKAFAAGSAIAWLDNNVTADFRSDNLRSRTLTAARKKAFYSLATSVSIFLLIWIIIMTIYSKNYDQHDLNAQTDLKAAWEIANPNSKKRMPSVNNIKLVLKKKLDALQKKYPGRVNLAGTDSASSTFMLLLRALNRLEENFDLRYKNLNFAAESVPIFTGSVPNLKDYEKLREVINHPDSQLEITQASFEKSGTNKKNDPTNRYGFIMPLRIRK